MPTLLTRNSAHLRTQAYSTWPVLLLWTKRGWQFTTFRRRFVECANGRHQLRSSNWQGRHSHKDLRPIFKPINRSLVLWKILTDFGFLPITSRATLLPFQDLPPMTSSKPLASISDLNHWWL